MRQRLLIFFRSDSCCRFLVGCFLCSAFCLCERAAADSFKEGGGGGRRREAEEREEEGFFSHCKTDLKRHAHTLSGVAGADLQSRLEGAVRTQGVMIAMFVTVESE